MRRILLAAAAVAAAALVLAVLLPAELPPRDLAEPSARSVFTAAQIDRAQDYRRPGYVLALAGLVLPPAAAALLAWRWRPAPGGGIGRGTVRALATLAAAWAAGLPVVYWAHRRAGAAGLDLRSDAAWAGDVAVALGVLLVAGLVAYPAAVMIARRTRRFALVGGAAVTALAAAYIVLQPVAFDPLVMHTEPVSDPVVLRAAADLEPRLAAPAGGIDVSDAGSRTSAENAWTDGLGPTERIVLWDTFLADAGPGEVRALLAHELAHVSRRHTLKGLGWLALLAPAVLAVAALAAGRRGGVADPRAAPALVAAVLVSLAALAPLTNVISRRIEAEADWVAVRASGDGRGMERLDRRLALANLSDPDPPRWAVILFATHPPVIERIAAARAAERGS